MSLHFYLVAGGDGQITIPIVFKNDVIDNLYAIEPYRHLIALHNDAECIPFAELVVFYSGRC